MLTENFLSTAIVANKVTPNLLYLELLAIKFLVFAFDQFNNATKSAAILTVDLIDLHFLT